MGAVVDKLILGGESYKDEELQRLQLEGASERLQEQRTSIRALDHRATEAGVGTISSAEHLIPLLFAHKPTRPTPRHLSRGVNGN